MRLVEETKKWTSPLTRSNRHESVRYPDTRNQWWTSTSNSPCSTRYLSRYGRIDIEDFQGDISMRDGNIFPPWAHFLSPPPPSSSDPPISVEDRHQIIDLDESFCYWALRKRLAG